MIKAVLEKRIVNSSFTARKSNIAAVLFATGILLIVVMFIHAAMRLQADTPALNQMSGLAGTLELTDLCFFSEARYVRHLSQADLHSAFQDHPASLEHFPAGSIAGPPVNMRRLNEKLD